MEKIHTTFTPVVCFGVGKGAIRLEEENVETLAFSEIFYFQKKRKNLK